MIGFSVKLKLTAWLTALMAVMSVLFLVFMLFISSDVITKTAITQLSTTVRNNLSRVALKDGKLNFGDGFVFYHNGVSTLIYNKNSALIAGQIPISFKTGADFENGVTRAVGSGNEQYLISDLWLPIGWDDGLWVRGVMEAPEQAIVTRNMIYVALVAFPIFMLLAALGSYIIAKRTFRPLDSITATASTINDANDLSGRIAISARNDEFSRLANTFDKMFERLERSFEAEKQFTADASHELRTPLSVIKGACEYAQKYDETPQERRETIAMIHRQATSMSNLISQLLNMTRLDQGTEHIRLELINLSELVSSVCNEYETNDSSIEIKLQPNVMAMADSALLSRLLQNLLQNSVKYGKPNGHILVFVTTNLDECLVSVSDDGTGISTDDIEKVWQRFYQSDFSRGEDSGAGLGLSIVQQIAKAHGGYMTLESNLGIGSTFTLHLPALEIKNNG